jgi:hypothetical protein
VCDVPFFLTPVWHLLTNACVASFNQCMCGSQGRMCGNQGRMCGNQGRMCGNLRCVVLPFNLEERDFIPMSSAAILNICALFNHSWHS